MSIREEDVGMYDDELEVDLGDDLVDRLNRAYDEVFYLVGMQRRDNYEEWGYETKPNGLWLTILLAEVGKIAEACLKDSDKEYELTDRLIKTMTVCITWLEDLALKGRAWTTL